MATDDCRHHPAGDCLCPMQFKPADDRDRYRLTPEGEREVEALVKQLGAAGRAVEGMRGRLYGVFGYQHHNDDLGRGCGDDLD